MSICRAKQTIVFASLILIACWPVESKPADQSGGLRQSGGSSRPFVPANADLLEFEVDGAKAFLLLPRATKPDSASRSWVWFAPYVQQASQPDQHERWIFERLIAAGIAVAGIDVGESFGNDAGSAHYSKLYFKLIHEYAMSRYPCLLPESRGGLMLYRWALDNPEMVACIAGIFPVVDLTSWPQPGDEHFREAAAAYSLSQTEFLAKRKQLSPIEKIEVLAAKRIPIFHVHGTRDTSVSHEANTVWLKERYERVGGAAQVLLVDAGHEKSPLFFECGQLVAFLIANVR